IYISRTKQKLYVRRNTHKPAPDGGGEVFDTTIEAPVTIRNPEKRIGTHVFTAMARKDAGLRWTVVTIDDADDAKDALDRITIPQDVLDRIGPTASPRSSIVVSDEPLSAETNYRTEFVAVLSNQPQGGFITREPSTETFVANDNFRNDDGYGFFFQRNWSPQTGNARRWWGNQYYR
ncbi:MAG: L,D-transpeptidase, partial [Pseudolabrys sp.]